MKYLLIFSLLILNTFVFSLEFIDSDRTITYTRHELEKFEQITIDTHRNKDGEELDDQWIGVKLHEILNKHEIKDFDKLCFTSQDNYLVRITKDDLVNNECILALQRNGKLLSEDHIRLVIPNLRDMFWIQDISTIRTETISDVPFPHTIFFAEPIISEVPIRKELPPFVKVEGYTFREIMEKAFPFLKDKVLLIGKDGVKHNLDYDKYLKNSVLVKNGKTFDLKSPDMPAGMWIKDLAYVQIFDAALIFNSRFESLLDVNKIAKWNNFPDEVVKFPEEDIKLSSKLKFNNEKWSAVRWLEW